MARFGIFPGLDPHLGRFPEPDILIPVVIIDGIILHLPVQGRFGIAVVVHNHGNTEACRIQSVDLGCRGRLNMYSRNSASGLDGFCSSAEHDGVPAEAVQVNLANTVPDHRFGHPVGIFGIHEKIVIEISFTTP